MVSCNRMYCLKSRPTEEIVLDRQDINIDSTEYKTGMLAITSQKIIISLT